MEGTERLDRDGVGQDLTCPFPVGKKEDDPGVPGWWQGYRLFSGAVIAGELPSMIFHRRVPAHWSRGALQKRV